MKVSGKLPFVHGRKRLAEQFKNCIAARENEGKPSGKATLRATKSETFSLSCSCSCARQV